MPTSQHLAVPQKLNERVYLLPPLSNPEGLSITANPARLHLVGGYMTGSSKAVARYVESLRALEPDSHILIILAFGLDFLTTSQATFLTSLQPAVNIIQERTNSFGKHQALGHFHCFSNGGAHAATMLAKALSATGSNSPALAIKSIVLDSAPGDTDLCAAIAAWTVGFKNSNLVVRWLGKSLLFVVFGFASMLIHLGLLQDALPVIRQDLLNAVLIPRTIPRHYIYSRIDSISPPKHIVSHAKQAALLSADPELVSTREYLDSGHVAHAKVHREQYWGEVASVISHGKSLSVKG